MQKITSVLQAKLGRTLVWMTAQFCFLEFQNHMHLVQSLYTVVIFCTVYPRVHYSVTWIPLTNQFSWKNNFLILCRKISWNKLSDLILFLFSIKWYRGKIRKERSLNYVSKLARIVLLYLCFQVNLKHRHRGNLMVSLVSAEGTTSKLATARQHDRYVQNQSDSRLSLMVLL